MSVEDKIKGMLAGMTVKQLRLLMEWTDKELVNRSLHDKKQDGVTRLLPRRFRR